MHTGLALPVSLMSGHTARDVSGQQLTVLPETIGALSTLEILDVDENQLTALPESLGQLTYLEKLAGYNGFC
jgi:Leucine-rich repeat (LRR) protein